MINFLPKTNPYILKLENYVTEINSLEPTIKTLSDFEIREEVNKLIKRFKTEQNYEKLMVKSFALTREASSRTIGLRHYDTQLMGGIVLHEGKVAEMKTGEGKTLVATLPVALNALSLKGVHVITPNEYLARRDQQLMSQLYRFLGFSVGLVQEKMNFTDRKKNYATDITYLTNTELAFDYLRDHMATTESEVVQRPFNYCIVDEVDSILIDESRTPLIISGPSFEDMSKYQIANNLVGYLKSGIHFEVNEKAKNVTLTTLGFKKIKTLLNVNNLFDDQNPWVQYILNALKAKSLYKKNVNYIIYENKLYIVDEFTGRILQNRQWGEGLHQAVQAKEFLPIDPKSETYASITYQNFFNLYPKLSGMTGTAKTEEVELDKLFNLEVITIPTTKKLIRRDIIDEVYGNEFQKWKAIVKECETIFATGCPILIGTTSIEKSEIISRLLSEKKIPHKLLNAKPESIKKESEIVAQAGCLYSVTVATNLAGRGTDILLGGNPDFKARRCVINFINSLKIQTELGNAILYNSPLLSTKNLNNKNFLNFIKKYDLKIFRENLLILSYLKNDDIIKILNNILNNGYTDKKEKIYIFIKDLYEYFFQQCEEKTKLEKLIIQKLGGLYIIGTERHESQRIDNQLRGRAGRQGDPGKSKFFVSLNDPLFKIFGNIPVQTEELSNSLSLSSIFVKQLDSIQKKVESYYYESRKSVFDFDKILDSQRKLLFNERQKILNVQTIRPTLIYYGEEIICNLVFELKSLTSEEKTIFERKKFKKLMKEISLLLQIPYFLVSYEDVSKTKYENLCNIFLNYFWTRYDMREIRLQRYKDSFLIEVEKIILLNTINKFWKLHLQYIDLLQECVAWRTYARLNSLSEYENEAFYLFIATINKIKYNSIIEILLRNI